MVLFLQVSIDGGVVILRGWQRRGAGRGVAGGMRLVGWVFMMVHAVEVTILGRLPQREQVVVFPLRLVGETREERDQGEQIRVVDTRFSTKVVLNERRSARCGV